MKRRLQRLLSKIRRANWKLFYGHIRHHLYSVRPGRRSCGCKPSSEQQLRAGDIDGAQRAFRQAFNTLPEAEAARAFQALILPMPLLLATQGRRKEAVLLMREFQPRAWNEVKALEQIGLFYLSLEVPADAQEVFKRAVEIDPASATLWHSLGVALPDGSPFR